MRLLEDIKFFSPEKGGLCLTQPPQGRSNKGISCTRSTATSPKGYRLISYDEINKMPSTNKKLQEGEKNGCRVLLGKIAPLYVVTMRASGVINLVSEKGTNYIINEAQMPTTKVGKRGHLNAPITIKRNVGQNYYAA